MEANGGPAGLDLSSRDLGRADLRDADLGGGLAVAERARDDNRLLKVAKGNEIVKLLRRRYDEAAVARLHTFLEQEPPLATDVVRELIPFTTNLTRIYD